MLYDVEDTKELVNELLAIIDDLRPEDGAKLISRRKLSLMALISDDADLLTLLQEADHMSLFWEYPDGRVEQQRIHVEHELVAV